MSKFIRELSVESDEGWKGTAYIRELKTHLKNLMSSDYEAIGNPGGGRTF